MLNLQNIEDAKRKLDNYSVDTFINRENSFRQFLHKIEVASFRHIDSLPIDFIHPVSVLSGINKIGKTSILLMIACSHYDFLKVDATSPTSEMRRHTWRDVIAFTHYENTTRNYRYMLSWRIGNAMRHGEGKRLASSQAWSGLGKYSSDPRRINAQIRNKQVRFIDFERVLPARSFSNSLYRKVEGSTQQRLNTTIEQAFAYILEIPSAIEIHHIGAHINKNAYLINYGDEPYSTYNAASGEEALIAILKDIIEAPEESLILIDEVEAGFHPNIQRRLADVIQYIAWRHKKQFIITSHSPTLISAFSKNSRIFIDKAQSGAYEVIPRIPMWAAFSRMDAKAYPLVTLYCEDTLAEFLIKNVLLEINTDRKHFDRLINIIKSGPANLVKQDYERHKSNYSQMRLKVGYSCVFDGDYKDIEGYSHYFESSQELSSFLYPYDKPEKFLVRAYLDKLPNSSLETALRFEDHHMLFPKMVNLGLATDNNDARNKCWQCFTAAAEYEKFRSDLKAFLLRVVDHYSQTAD